MIQTIEDVQRLVVEGFDNWKEHGEVAVSDLGWGKLFNYTPLASYKGVWTPLEVMSRGLIISNEGDIVSRPFDKFYNWGERGRTTESPISYVMEKMDGSMGAIYFHPVAKDWFVSTRGSIMSEQAAWASNYLHNYDTSTFPDEWTILVEIIYPENRIVVDYEGRGELVLIAARHRETGRYMGLNELRKLSLVTGLTLAPIYEFKSPEDIQALLPTLSMNEEGYVAVFQDGQRFKFKGEKYIRLHASLSELRPKRTIGYIMDGLVEEMLSLVPDELLDEIKLHLNDIHEQVESFKEEAATYLSQFPDDVPPKDVVMKLREDGIDDIRFSCVMNMFRGKEVDRMILRHLQQTTDNTAFIFERPSTKES